MPSYGGMSPYPRRYGGKGSGIRLELILQSLNQARGTAYDTSWSSVVYAENMALARGLNAAWGTNARVANAFDPQRIPAELLPRWEGIFGIFPAPNTTDPQRRAPIVAKWQRFGQTFNTSRVATMASTLLGTTLVAIQYTTAAGATTFWPGGTTSTTTPWYSTVRHILFKVTQPSGMSDGEFYDTVNSINAWLDGEAPSDCTWDWWRVDAVHGTQGFWLDSAHNLGNDAFDV